MGKEKWKVSFFVCINCLFLAATQTWPWQANWVPWWFLHVEINRRVVFMASLCDRGLTSRQTCRNAVYPQCTCSSAFCSDLVIRGKTIKSQSNKRANWSPACHSQRMQTDNTLRGGGWINPFVIYHISCTSTPSKSMLLGCCFRIQR